MSAVELSISYEDAKKEDSEIGTSILKDVLKELKGNGRNQYVG